MTMKKNILSMVTLLIASATVFTACSSDDNIIGEQPTQPTDKYAMTITANAMSYTQASSSNQGVADIFYAS